jgi:very-short-patch-repair endonuclease
MDQHRHQNGPIDPEHLAFARKLRQQKTDAEGRLWSRLRGRRLGGHKFRRQYPCGPYTLDFVCLEQLLVIEVDGGQHSEPEHEDHDERRTAYLNSRRLRVVRFWCCDVLKETDAVCRTILRAIEHPEIVQGRISAR